MFETLSKSPDDWNHPTWPRRLVPVCAALGAIATSLGAGLAVIVAWLALAAPD